MNYRRPLIQINCYELFSPFLEMECNVIWVKNCRILHVSRCMRYTIHELRRLLRPSKKFLIHWKYWEFKKTIPASCLLYEYKKGKSTQNTQNLYQPIRFR